MRKRAWLGKWWSKRRRTSRLGVKIAKVDLHVDGKDRDRLLDAHLYFQSRKLEISADYPDKVTHQRKHDQRRK